MLEFNEMEKKVLTALAKQKNLSEHAVLRSALRIYQLVEHHQNQGHQLRFETNNGAIINPFGMEKYR